MPVSLRIFSDKLCKNHAGILTYFKDFESDLPVRVSGGDLCAAEAPTEPVGETKITSEMGTQSVGRDLFSGSLIIIPYAMGK